MLIGTEHILTLVIGKLGITFNPGVSGAESALPACHQKFLLKNLSEEFCSSEIFSKLSLQVSFVTDLPGNLFVKPICQTRNWELWEDFQNRLVFYRTREKPARVIIIEPDFSRGEIVINHTGWDQKPFYPLIYIDMVIFSNWLAQKGDLILHASGIAVQGQGYAFAGDSGKGKSTLVGDLEDNQGVTILGEDQVILRNMGGEYWIFGTPWHVNPRRCSPIGVPLKKLFFLDRDAPKVLTVMNAADAITGIMRSAFVPFYLPVAVEKILDNLGRLPGKVPCQTLAYKRGSDILPVIMQ